MKEFPSWFVAINDAAALLLALSVNATLLHLIHRRTPDFLRPYAQILRIHSITDICCDMMLFLVGPQVYPFNNRLHYMNKGIWKARSPAELMRQINIFNWLAVFLPAFMVTIDFVFRWLLMCHQYRMSNRQLAAYAVTVCVSSLLIGYPYFSTIMRTDPKLITKEEMDYFKRMLETDTVPLVGINVTNEPLTVFIIFVFNGAIGAEYAFIFYIVRRITQTTAKEMMQTVKSNSISATNRHITRIMFLQAAVPLLICAPVSITITTSMLGLDSPMLGAVSSLVLAWLAVVRPAATILIIPHYRDCVLWRFGVRKKPRRQSQSTGSRGFQFDSVGSTLRSSRF